MWTVVCAYLLCILVIPYVEYSVPSVNMIKGLPEHVLRNHSQYFFWEGNQFAEVLALIMNVMDRGAVCVRIGMLHSLKIPHIWIFSVARLWICRYYLKDYHSPQGRWHWSWSPMITWLHFIYTNIPKPTIKGRKISVWNSKMQNCSWNTWHASQFTAISSVRYQTHIGHLKTSQFSHYTYLTLQNVQKDIS